MYMYIPRDCGGQHIYVYMIADQPFDDDQMIMFLAISRNLVGGVIPKWLALGARVCWRVSRLAVVSAEHPKSLHLEFDIFRLTGKTRFLQKDMIFFEPTLFKYCTLAALKSAFRDILSRDGS